MRYELTREKYLNDSEVAALYATLDKFESREPRNVCLIRLALATGARASELLFLTAHDFDHANKAIYIHGLKRSMDRWIPLDAGLFKLLTSLPLTDGRPFAIGYNRLCEIWGEYRPSPESRFHSLRHRFALDLYKRSRDIHLVQRMLGHKNLQTTTIYMSFSYGIDEMRKAMGL